MTGPEMPRRLETKARPLVLSSKLDPLYFAVPLKKKIPRKDMIITLRQLRGYSVAVKTVLSWGAPKGRQEQNSAGLKGEW